MNARLRYRSHDLALPLGTFVLGRALSCHLSLDDSQVSRRHAMLAVAPSGITLEDMGSRHGTFVNGKRVEGPTLLKDGDEIALGHQTLQIRMVESGPDARRKWPTDPGGGVVGRLTPAELHEEPVDEEPTSVAPLPGPAPSSPDKRVHAFALIASVADKALAMGRSDEAERLLADPLREVLAKAQVGSIPDDDVFRALDYCFKLARGSGRGTWIEHALQIAEARSKLLPSPLVDELYEALRTMEISRRRLESYVAAVRRSASSSGATDLFRLSRIEGLLTVTKD